MHCAIHRCVTVIGLALLWGSCATEPPPLNKTQTESVNKAMFTGEWYFKMTVTDTEWHNPYTFIGEESHTYLGAASKLRWEITQDFLNGYLVPQVYLDPDGNPVTNSIGRESLVLSFKIEKHFDIRYLQNNTTREELNVIVENTDRPWNEREYMIVDWSQNLATNLWEPLAATEEAGQLVREPVATWKNVEFFDTDDQRVDTRAWRPDRDPDVYVANIDIQEQIHPTVRYWWQIYDGNAEPVKVRYRISLMKKNPRGVAERTYQPQSHRDEYFRRFGFFRTEYATYDPDRGPLESQKQYLINRWDTGCGVNPVNGQWECKKIVFHASPSMPTEEEDPDLWTWTRDVVQSWNEALKLATGREDDVLELRANDVLTDAQGNPVLAADGTPRYRYELGDIRYNFINYVTKPGAHTPLGYGPSTPDPDTGEIINASVNVYGNWVDYVVTRALDLYDVVAGNCSMEDVMAGSYWDEDAEACTGGGDPIVAKDRGGQSVDFTFLTPALQAAYWPKGRIHRRHVPLDPTHQAAMKPVVRELMDLQVLESKPADLGKFSIAQGTPYEAKLVPSASYGSTFAGAHSVDQVTADYSPSARLTEARMAEIRAFGQRRGRHCHLEPDHYDNNILAFIEEMAGKPRAEVKQALRKWIYYTTLLHEMGHTLGLRHNFRGSVDKQNFPTEFHDEYQQYWNQVEALRGQFRDAIDSGDATAYQAYVEAVYAIPSKHERFATSSIMDYNGDYEGWIRLPSYDRAAIAFGYGQKVEVDNNGTWEFVNYLPGDFEVEDPLLPNQVAASGREVRYYQFCSDERVWDDVFCSRHDRGVTATEIVRNFIRDQYKGYFFRNFKRDRESFGTTSRYWRKWMKYYNYAKSFSQIVVNNIWYGDFWSSLWSGLSNIHNGPESRHMVPGYHQAGGEDLLRASLLFYQYLLNDVLQRPDYGMYKLQRDAFGNQYWAATEERFTQAGDLTAVIDPGPGWGWADKWDNQYDPEIYEDRLIRAGVELDKIIAYEVLSIPAVLNEHLWHEKANGNTFWGDLWTGGGMQLWKVTRGFITDVVAHDQNPWCMDEHGVLTAYPSGLLEGVAHAGIINADPFEGVTRCPAGSYPVQPGMDDLYAIYPIFYGISGSQHPWYHNHLSDYLDSQVKGGNHRFDVPEGAEVAEFLNSTGTKTYQAVQTADGLSISYQLVDKARRISNRIRFMQACDAEETPSGEPQKLVGTHDRSCEEVLECLNDPAPTWCAEEGWDAAYTIDTLAWRDVDRVEAMLIMMQDMIDLAGHYAWRTPGYLDEP